MPWRQPDTFQTALLWRIYNGEKSFRPPINEDDYADYEYLVETLIWLKENNYIPRDKLHVRSSRGRNGFRYLVALVDGLTHDGIRIARALGPAPAAPQLSSLLSAEGLDQCQRDFARAIGAIGADPDQAVASAVATLESVCKAILDSRGVAHSPDMTLSSVIGCVIRNLRLSETDKTDDPLRSAIQALATAANSIGTLRNKASAAHGRAPNHVCMAPHHARFAINSAAAVALFLLESAVTSDR